MYHALDSSFKCLQYNGCKWLGGVLRVEKAKEPYLARLHREWVAKSDLEEEEVQEPVDTDHASFQLEPLRIPTPASGFVKRKVYFNPSPLLTNSAEATWLKSGSNIIWQSNKNTWP